MVLQLLTLSETQDIPHLLIAKREMERDRGYVLCKQIHRKPQPTTVSLVSLVSLPAKQMRTIKRNDEEFTSLGNLVAASNRRVPG